MGPHVLPRLCALAHVTPNLASGQPGPDGDLPYLRSLSLKTQTHSPQSLISTSHWLRIHPPKSGPTSHGLGLCSCKTQVSPPYKLRIFPLLQSLQTYRFRIHASRALVGFAYKWLRSCPLMGLVFTPQGALVSLLLGSGFPFPSILQAGPGA